MVLFVKMSMSFISKFRMSKVTFYLMYRRDDRFLNQIIITYVDTEICVFFRAYCWQCRNSVCSKRHYQFILILVFTVSMNTRRYKSDITIIS